MSEEKNRIELLTDLCKRVGMKRKKQKQYLSKRELIHILAYLEVVNGK